MVLEWGLEKKNINVGLVHKYTVFYSQLYIANIPYATPLKEIPSVLYVQYRP